MSAEGCAALIAAAGEGSRLGLGPKFDLRTRDGRSLVQRLAEAAVGVVDQVCVAVPAAACDAVTRELPFARVIAGGADRTASYTALLAASELPWMMLLDVARAFTRPALMRRVLAAARERDGAAMAVQTLALPAALVDTRGHVVDAVPRDAWRLPQTPQVFRREQLALALEAAAASGAQTLWEGALVAGVEIACVAGDADNLKITTAEDWALARALHDPESPT